MPTPEATDLEVRAAVYDSVMSRSKPFTARELSQTLDLPLAEAKASLERLASGKVLVLQPESREVLMAPPFSAVPTPFAVFAADRLYFGNCIWDALGIPAMLNADGVIRCSCGDCGASAEVFVESGAVRGEGLIHFAIPARLWWKDIVFT